MRKNLIFSEEPKLDILQYMWFFGKPLTNEEVIKVNVEFVKFVPACDVLHGLYIKFDLRFKGVHFLPLN